MTNGLSAKAICTELARLMAERLEIPPEAFTSEREFGSIFIMHCFGVRGGLLVAVKTMPLESTATLGRRSASVVQGGADRFLTLDAFSQRFMVPSVAVLGNCLLEAPPGSERRTIEV